ncbi:MULTISPECIES: bifunctional diguanylate cyclase/phosphodiesterase [unclassified Methylophaga]|uniref:bifunctional diguanylate cyclase/phosphodiesterase n=1 Tax=unclassified Methylophaga TaxID=2629249 RepID=UPI000C8DF0BC|nr:MULTISPECIES: EAL domain-containing protein [unclassified Methylophaga]MBN45722.1 bifunctional diguanylate cyclase/phosphodiesterase [Methylophaga sp.]
MRHLIATKLVFNSMIAIIALLIFSAAIYIDYVIQDRYSNALQAKTQQKLSQYHNNLVTNLQNHIQIIRGLPGLFAVNPELTQEQFEVAMSHLIGEHTQLRNIAAAPDMVIRYMYPVAGNEQAIGLDYRQEPTQAAAAERARVSRNLVLAGPLELKQGGTGLITRIPVYLLDDQQQEYFWGIISAVIDVDAFFEASGLNAADLPIEMAIRGKDGLGEQGEVFFGEEALFDNARLTMPLALPEGHWVLVGQPKGGWKGGLGDVKQSRILLFCIAIAIFALLTAFVRFMFSASMANLKFRQVIESSPIPYILVGKERKVSFINPAFTELYGYTLDDLPTLALWWEKTNVSKDYLKTVNEWWSANPEHKLLPDSSLEVSIYCLDGSERVALLSVSPLHDAVNNELLLVFYDITTRKQAEQKIHFSEQIFRQAHEGIVVTDTKSRILEVNPAFTEITGYTMQEALQGTPAMLKSGKHNDDFFQQMWHSLENQGYWQGEVWNRHKEGHLYALLLTITAMTNPQGDKQFYVGLFSDITQSKTQQEKLELMAHYDVLTHLPNRVLFADRYSQAVAHSQRLGTWVGVCFLDLDDFKPVNDTHGHNIGDLLLIDVADRLRASVREEDTISRFGGDEFAILFRDISSYEQCEQLLTRLHQTLAEPYWIDNQRIVISASSGIALYPMDNVDLDTLLRHADQAMYQAKITGRNTFRLFNPELNQQVMQKHHVVHRLREALLNNEFVLHYQPEINMKTGEIIAVEALIRWQHPESGLLYPNEFLSVVEGSDLEFDLGLWVVESALSQLQQWQQAGLNLVVSVNIAANHLHAINFIQSLQQILSRYPDIKPSSLQLEILESSTLGDVHTLSRIIDECRHQVGVQIALDDFGTGYSSLTHLRHLAANSVKIDQSFVRDMLEDPSDYNIVDGVISLAKAFNRQVIAEGVETIEHGLMLLSMGCELAQGYQIARPMPAEDILVWCQEFQLEPVWQKQVSKTDPFP